MTVEEAIAKLSEYPPKANTEVCVRYKADYAVDYELKSITPVDGTDEWVTLNLGSMVCDHA